ncbi:MAG TPA: hypothetical protein VMS35_07995 [Nitrososphaeraceae archaeon]|nr:hypothetical protein [Nitrososphaeraceae archaeon]
MTNNNNNPVFNPEEIVKKEARGISNNFLGQVQEITSDNIVVEKGAVEKEDIIFQRIYSIVMMDMMYGLE